MTEHPATRGTLFVEDGKIVARDAYDDDQFVLHIQAPKIAVKALPGSFVHLTCDAALPMRRPLSIMGASPERGLIEVLFKTHGLGLTALAQQAVGTKLSLIGPIGQPFKPNPERPLAMMIGGGVGIPPMVFLAEAMAEDAPDALLVLMGSEIAFPFEQALTSQMVGGISADVNASMRRLNDLKVSNRLASLAGFEGCYSGYVTDLAREVLRARSDDELAKTNLFACGPTPMLAATARVAAEFDLPCQVSLEEYMACAVGGCAGCTVEVVQGGVTRMQRVCVDGPVFEASHVFPAA